MNKKRKDTKHKRYLLILSCSKQKKRLSEVSAIELYDGPFYRMVRKSGLTNLDIFIISAKYGLISAYDTISYYNQVMSVQRAKELAEGVKLKLERALENNGYGEIFINLGKTYALALENSKKVLSDYNVYWARGQIGERLNQLKRWLSKINLQRGGNL